MFALVVMVRAIRMQMEGAKLALGSALVLVVTIAYDILVSYNVFPQPYIMQYGIDVFVFLQSQVVARRFATAFRTAERLQNELQIEVDRQTQDIRSLMEHVPQVIFLVLDDMTIQPHYSRYLEDILGQKELSGLSVTELLFQGHCITPEQRSIIETIMLSAFGSDLYAWDVNSWQLPRELNFTRGDGQQRILEIDWNAVVSKSQEVERLLITIRDVTSMRALQVEKQHRQAELDCLIELLGAELGTLPRFFELANIHLEKSRNKLNSTEATDQIKRLVFIELHSLKGLARSQGLRRLTSAVHDAEQHYGPNEKFQREKLQSDLTELAARLQEYQLIYQQKISREANSGAELPLEKHHLVLLESKLHPLQDNLPLDAPSRELMHAVQDFLSVYLYRSAQHVFDGMLKEVDRLAVDLGKEKPRVSLIGLESLMLRPRTENMVQSSFLHVVRNSLDHGIENAQERLDQGKAPQGHIMLVVREVDGRFEITYEDDGRGVQISRIEKKARDQGLWKLTRPMTVSEATEMLFHPGFSTKDTVSEISGRGVGLDAVRMQYRELGGDVIFNLDGVDIENASSLPFRLWAYLPSHVAARVS
ncbi:MAG TPA: ATP-binding protein [Oligoflexus sp.]|uniref:ATP-binding protein n=1 Tax=Oligoflexus sp. TaxID=1971216 RepID=UPI002D5BE27A|nr:ATP-binding protein [Oligoflexus sp.]HYX34709.1 ATP-binding protein [Oligoflexus sp.]